MTFEERYGLAISELKSTPIVEGNYAPPMHRLLRRLGVRVRPPHYCPIWFNIFATGIPFAILWGVLMWLILWQSQNIETGMAFAAGLIAGAIFGVFMSLYYRWSFNRNELTQWDKLVPAEIKPERSRQEASAPEQDGEQ